MEMRQLEHKKQQNKFVKEKGVELKEDILDMAKSDFTKAKNKRILDEK